VDLTGNICDHLTRYLIVRTVADKLGYSWSINKKTSHDYFNGQEQIGFFENIDYGIPNDTPYGEMPEGITNIWEEKHEDYDGYSFHPFQPDIFSIPDNTKLVLRCMHDARYFDKEKVAHWLKIKEEKISECNQILKENHIELDENLCVMNCRGGEYRGIPSLFLGRNYWVNAINYMKRKNPIMKFIIVTDDPEFYKHNFDYPVYHFGIDCDYFVVNQAQNLILSNSGFGIFPSWTNPNVKNLMAPKFWSRHNVSPGYWANSNIFSYHFNFMDRRGILFDYDEIMKEEKIKVNVYL
jgi:hypothetical protein